MTFIWRMCNWPLWSNQSQSNGLEVVPAVLVQGDGPHGGGGQGRGEVVAGDDADLDPVLAAVALAPLDLDKMVQESSVQAGDGL